MNFPRRVVLTGAECTGKTTMAEHLGRVFGAPWSPEYARRYVEGLGRPLALADVPLVGRGQVEGEDEAIARAEGVVLHDTDLLSTVVYSRYYFGACPDGIEPLARERRADLYLLHHPDVPWRPDPGMRGEDHDREQLHGLFGVILQSLRANVVPVRGSWEERTALAEEAVRRLLDVPGARFERSG
jgi:NadR type nicotinamide-nucleotide adenylyltransferase